MKRRETANAAARLVALVGKRRWNARIEEVRARAAAQRIAGRVVAERHALELAVDRLAAATATPRTRAEAAILSLASALVSLAERLPPSGQERLATALAAATEGEGTLVPLFHLVRVAALNRARGFTVRFSGLEEGSMHDLVIERDGAEAEIVAAVVSADEGRWVHKGDWFALVDRLNPDLERWLAAHPGRYLLKLTLPEGLSGPEGQSLVQERINALLAEDRRSDHSEAAILRLDPLLLAQNEANQAALMQRLRAQFGPEAHFAVMGGERSVFVMAARAGRENEVAAVLRRRLAELPARLSGGRPGILAVFIEDTDRTEWRGLRERLEIEGATRNFLTAPEARPVIAVTCASRFELLDMPEPDAAPGGELRFRNPAHPKAKDAALAPAVTNAA
ncbi:hypothetical protein KO353_14675 [Elioraea tepida]|jgi:hypothetical protein|uniref:Uncharacterized protein n=1 Tax=Elioraea tepida TaxID=2843330 RepID=A0A975U330_9PROT|nr:hypothetical protein [Elioraea tepida]QXM24468.1 hypothetical protein KO353_14675 [Elioraea tepida]